MGRTGLQSTKVKIRALEGTHEGIFIQNDYFVSSCLWVPEDESVQIKIRMSLIKGDILVSHIKCRLHEVVPAARRQ